jgi:stress response protein YsnF
LKQQVESGAAIPLAQERLRVDKKIVERDRVVVKTHVDERTAWVREELAREDVQVTWVDIDREVDEPPAVRTEGDTIIIPLFEEVLVVERRLVLRQEIHLTRKRSTERFDQPVTLRRTTADIHCERPSRPPTKPERKRP